MERSNGSSNGSPPERRRGWVGAAFAAAVVVASLGHGSLGTPGPEADGITDGPEPWVPDAVLTTVVDPARLRAEFAETGQVRLEVPVLGEVVVLAQPVRIREGERNEWSEVLADGTILFHPDPSVAVEGTAPALPGSHARMLLGEHGVYGRLAAAGFEVLFDPVYDASTGAFTQTASFAAGDVQLPQPRPAVNPCNQVPAPQGCHNWPCGVQTQSFVQLDADERLRNARPDWRDRIAAGFTGHHGSWEMWKDICVELLMKNGAPRAIPDIGGHTSGVEALQVYRDWLRGDSTRTTESSAYQLWTHRDLFRCPDINQALCPGQEDNSLIGIAWVNRAVLVPTAANKDQQANALSIVEGTKFGGGSYDPNRDWDMARVGGHELSHTYGEEGHQDHCKAGNNCNIMRAVFNNDVQTYWTDWSRCEVYRWFFHGDEYTGPPQPCPNWYEP